MKSIKNFLTFLLIANLVGCASHSTMRGSVAMKISDTEAHVCLGDKEVKVGDKVVAFQNVCTPDANRVSRAGKVTPCKKVQLGSGEVTSLINDHYSVVKFDSKFDFNEGTIIEKQ
ncbi:MAG: hypothetical protein H7281_11390 [Bacteriovorax sp.]|nr:hypothetical protein [Bacteriovorax sp.]